MASNLIIARQTELPAGLDQLVQTSLAEGFRFVQVLRDQWNSGANRFTEPGEGFFAAYHRGSLAGVCGLNRDPHSADPAVGRLRRLFVSEPFRRQGVGRAVVLHTLSFAREHFSLIRVWTDMSDADVFYRALGFSRVRSPLDATHELQLSRGPAAEPGAAADTNERLSI
jgi:GNAT superfamily N-acetyltransferase